MDGNRFDRLTTALATGRSRRDVAKGLAAGAAAAAGTALGLGPARAKTNSDPCKSGCSNFQRKAKTACQKACQECGGDFDRVCFEEGPLGPVAINCCPVGTFCVQDTGVCCPEGTEPCREPDGAACCPEGTFCNFEFGECQPFVGCVECADNPCGFAPRAVCGNNPETGACLCAETVDGTCACIQPFCREACDPSAPACGEGFVCISAQCCDAPACAPLCETIDGATAARQRRWDGG